MSEYIIGMSSSSYQSTSGLLCADVSQLREEIVRCRDCVYNAKDTDGICYRFDHEHFNQPDGFCKWGERHESESVEVWKQWSPDDVTCSEES